MTFEAMLKFGPVASGLLVAVLVWCARQIRSRQTSLEDFFVVGLTASSFPSGILFVVAAFDPVLLAKVSEAPVYIALAGAAILYIAVKTIREKL